MVLYLFSLGKIRVIFSIGSCPCGAAAVASEATPLECHVEYTCDTFIFPDH
jgi:hypothetical protein